MSVAPERYNFIYRRLVTAPDDIVGIVAYARYKQQKIEWIAAFKELHDGRDPDDSELAPFHSTTNTDTALQGYRLQAKELLDEWTSKTLDQINEQMNAAYTDQLQEEVRNIEARFAAATRPLLAEFKATTAVELKASRPTFLDGVLQNLVANILMLIITALVLIVIWSFHVSPLELIGEVFGWKITPTQQ